MSNKQQANQAGQSSEEADRRDGKILFQQFLREMSRVTESHAATAKALHDLADAFRAMSDGQYQLAQSQGQLAALTERGDRAVERAINNLATAIQQNTQHLHAVQGQMNALTQVIAQENSIPIQQFPPHQFDPMQQIAQGINMLFPPQGGRGTMPY